MNAAATAERNAVPTAALLRTFFDNLDSFAEAPEGVTKLRELILQLAARGALVAQDDSEGTGEQLLAEISDERDRLVKAKEIGKQKKLPPLEPDEKLHPIPDGWEWTRLGEVVDYNGRDKVKSEDISPDAWLLDLKDIEKHTSRLVERTPFKESPSKSTKTRFRAGDVLYGKLRPYLNKIIVADEDGYCTTEIVPLRIYCGIDPHYLNYLLRRPDFLNHVNELAYGINLPRLGTDDARAVPIPLPPLSEQRRIVTRVDGLMSLCDELESRGTERVSSRERANRSCLEHLTSSRSRRDLVSAWQRLSDHFDVLYDTPETLAHLRQSILQLAVQGKLVPQDPNDEPAEYALAAAEQERKQLIKAKQLKRQWKFPQLENGDLRFPIPDGWSWCRILDASERVTVGHVGSMKDEYVDDGIPFLRTLNVREDRYLPLGLKFISPEFHERLSKSTLAPGDVVVVRSGNVGTTCVIPDSLPVANCSDLVIVKRPIAVVAGYLSIYMNSAARVHVEAGTVGVALTHFNTKSVAAMPLSLPPLAEQKRIVAKVDQLLSQCDELSTRLRERHSTTQQLLTAIICHLLTRVSDGQR